MKKIITIILLFAALVSNATTYYISTSGNDITGNGSIGNPWRTLFKATSTVSGAGDIIHIVAGTYDETSYSELAVGVSIEGEGPANRGDTNNIPTSIIKATSLTTVFTPLINCSSVEGTNGNQHISNIKMEGQLSTYWGINVSGRSNFNIYDCYIVGFLDRGVIMHGRNDYMGFPPVSTYATGCSFKYNTIRDCSRFITDGTGCFCVGGTIDFEIAHNYMEQLNRASGYIGWPIKLENNGHNKGLLIDSNVVRKSPWTGTYGGEFGWNFCVELWNIEGGLQIWGNDFQGSLDLVHTAKGSYSFGAWIHHNKVSQPTLNNRTEDAFFFEKGGSDILVEYNTVDKTTHGVVIECEYFGDGDDSVNVVSNFTVRKNLFSNLGQNIGDGNAGYGFYLDGGVNPQLATVHINNIEIYNNTYTTTAGNAPFFCFGFNTNVSPGNIDTVKIYNNIVKGFFGSWLIAGSRTATWDKLFIHNNILYQNANSNTIWDPFSQPTNFDSTGNVVDVNPDLDVNFKPNTGSPAIDGGRNVGVAFNGFAPDIGYFETGSPDLTAPTVTATNPAAGSTGVSAFSYITITFDGAMDMSTLNSTNIFVTGKAGTVIAGTDYAVITFPTKFNYLTSYIVNIENVQDAAGNTIAAPYTFSFTTGSAIIDKVKNRLK